MYNVLKPIENPPESDLDQEERGVEPLRKDEYWCSCCILYFMTMLMVFLVISLITKIFDLW